MSKLKLYETINKELGKRNIRKIQIPEYISNNLKHSFFDWQKLALQYFLAYNKKENEFLKFPTHLMFNMATGTGKTLLMAATVLYYYKQRYRHFLFFVNQNNIIDKTENNFIENTHNKYLFTEKIVIDDQTVRIKKVGEFSDEPQSIEIKFTSIQKLYHDIHLEKENQTTLSDLQSKNIVMLADEAHHLNANTKNIVIQEEMFEEKLKGSKDVKEKKGWEHTVIELILNKQGEKANKNVLLEFTATIPENDKVAEKYRDKIIYKFTLKEFLQAGYTKEINLISSNLEKKERILQALVFQWYRHQIALKNNIANFKPVILFRSKTIEESKQDYQDFLNWIEDLKHTDFDFLKNIADKIFQAKQPNLFEMGKSRTEQVLKFIQKENIPYTEIANWIQQSYQERNTIITNSKTNTTKKEKTDEETEKLLNSLEDKNNHIRGIFTVDRLTEGWDVLNLFDIVRLYEGQNAGGNNSKNGKTPPATTKEKQLIGRGVRYFPFTYQDKLANKRKFDDDLKNELRVLEELYYYTYDDKESRYISHLKQELKKDGYITDDRVMKTFVLKESFKNSNFYKNRKIWYNKQEDNPNRQKKELNDIKKDFYFEYKIEGLNYLEQKDFLGDTKLDDTKNKEDRYKTISKPFKKIEKHIVLKAINIKAKQENSLLQFENLKKELNIKSIEDLWKSEFLGDFQIHFKTDTDYEHIENGEKLNATLQFLDKVFNELKEHLAPKIGSEFKLTHFKKFFGEPKTKSIEENNLDDSIVKNKWYVLDNFVGTSEEKALVNFIEQTIGNLQETFNEIYLLKNEEVYKIYDFDKGRGFAPDFLLFLKRKEELYYQIFIEPKGDQFKDSEGSFKNSKEGWKEKFLDQITKKYDSNKILKVENKNYRLIGLPFYNENSKKKFEKEFQQII